MQKKIYLILLIFTFVFAPLYSQKKARANKFVAQPVKSHEEIVFENLLESTAKVMFVDSCVVAVTEVYNHLPLAKSCGSLSMEKVDSTYNYTYTNEYKTIRYLSLKTADGNHKLYVQHRFGKMWDEPVEVNMEGDVNDIISPFLLQDGLTLYFAARGGEESLGGYDLYFTIFDADENKFLQPQSLGLPFNSFADDTFYAIDETSNLGYLVTTRNQKQGYCCIYVFQPTESRETYNTEELSDAKLKELAHLSTISQTQLDKALLKEVKARYDKIKSGAALGIETSGNKRFAKSSLLIKLEEDEAMLSQLRSQYHDLKSKGQNTNNLSKLILNLESKIQQQRIQTRRQSR